MTTGFWMEKPRMLGWRGLSLLLPSLVTAVGLCAFAVLAFSFTELTVLPEQFRTALVLTGAFALAMGGEVGTVFSVVEIYRKPERNFWDWSALVVSGAATFGAFLLAFAALLGVNSTWGPTVRMYGPIAQGILTAMDGYGLFVELGQYLGTYDVRMHNWQWAYDDYRKAQTQPGATTLTQQIADLRAKHPEWTQQEIATRVGCSRGHVSRTLGGGK